MRWQGTAGAGRFDTVLDFGSEGEYDVEMTTVQLSLARSIGPRRTLRLVAGGILDGSLQNGSRPEHDVTSGGLLALGLEHRVRPGRGWTPSIDLSGSFGLSWAATSTAEPAGDTDYFAGDLRLGALCGWSPVRNVTTYGAVRVFGGPVSWQVEGRDATGTDKYHFQVGGGASVALGAAALFAEIDFLGERALSAGISYTR